MTVGNSQKIDLYNRRTAIDTTVTDFAFRFTYFCWQSRGIFLMIKIRSIRDTVAVLSRNLFS